MTHPIESSPLEGIRLDERAFRRAGYVAGSRGVSLGSYLVEVALAAKHAARGTNSTIASLLTAARISADREKIAPADAIAYSPTESLGGIPPSVRVSDPKFALMMLAVSAYRSQSISSYMDLLYDRLDPNGPPDLESAKVMRRLAALIECDFALLPEFDEGG